MKLVFCYPFPFFFCLPCQKALLSSVLCVYVCDQLTNLNRFRFDCYVIRLMINDDITLHHITLHYITLLHTTAYHHKNTVSIPCLFFQFNCNHQLFFVVFCRMAMKKWFHQLRPVQLYLMLGLTIFFFLVQLIMSHMTHALTLLVDSYHMLCNVIALVGSIITIKVNSNSYNTMRNWCRLCGTYNESSGAINHKKIVCIQC